MKINRNPLKLFSHLEEAIRRFVKASAPAIPDAQVYYSSSQTRDRLNPGEVIYAGGWDAPYEIVSGSFCRINYFCWQGHLTSAPAAPQGSVNYLVRRLGGKRIARLEIAD